MTHIIKAKDPVSLIAVFDSGRVKPHSFRWSGKKFVVEEVNLTFSRKAGSGRLVYFSVTAEENYFKLVFDTANLLWFVEEVYSQ